MYAQSLNLTKSLASQLVAFVFYWQLLTGFESFDPLFWLTLFPCNLSQLASGAATHSSRPRSRMSSRPASVRSQQGYQMCNMGGIQQAPMASMPSSLMSQQATMSSQQQYGELGYASQSHEGASQSVTSEEPSVVTQVPRRQKRSRPNSLVSQGSGYGSQRHSVVSQDPVYSSQRHSVTSPMSQQFQSLTLSQQGYPSNKRHSLASEASQDPTYPFQRHNLASQGPTYLSQRHSVTSPQQFQSLTLSQQGYPSQPHHNITGEGSQRHSLASQPTSQISENIYILPDISEVTIDFLGCIGTLKNLAVTDP